LIAAFEVATGQVQGTVGDTRTEEDYVSFLESLFASSSATTPWHLVCDNLNTHVSEGVVRLVAKLCGIDDDPRLRWGRLLVKRARPVSWSRW